MRFVLKRRCSSSHVNSTRSLLQRKAVTALAVAPVLSLGVSSSKSVESGRLQLLLTGSVVCASSDPEGHLGNGGEMILE